MIKERESMWQLYKINYLCMKIVGFYFYKNDTI